MSISAQVDLQNPLMWAVLVGWVISVILHEFAHGLVAHWGGDYTIRQRGGLSLNPLQYVDPLTSLILPAAMLAMGAVPLPGAATYIRRDLLRSRFWDSAASLAGPAMNLLLFLACVIPLHPKIGWVDPVDPNSWTTGQVFLGTMAVLQLLAVALNLFPVPPLDGFQAIAPYLRRDLVLRVTTPPVSTFVFILYFLVVWTGQLLSPVLHALATILDWLGYGPEGGFFMVSAFLRAMFNAG